MRSSHKLSTCRSHSRTSPRHTQADRTKQQGHGCYLGREVEGGLSQSTRFGSSTPGWQIELNYLK